MTRAPHGTSCLDTGTAGAPPPCISLADRGRRSVPARMLAAFVAATIWSGPPAAHAAPIADPAAPVRFAPTMTATTGAAAPAGGVPVVNIATPNAQGISLNQYRSFVVDPVGLILNNSNIGGGSFLGGQVEANPHLSRSGPAGLIVNQVSGQAPALLNGTVEVYGGAAGVVIAAPGGVYTQGAGFTNTKDVTLTTGTPQWLTASGTATGFDAAAAAGFLVEGGRLQIGNAYPGNPRAAGIEGTVANMHLLAEQIGIDAALYAGERIDVIAGRQRVTPAPDGFSVSPPMAVGAASTPAPAALAIDATALGAMTAGQIRLVSTAMGLGVRADGDLAASAGGLAIDAAGNVKVGSTYAKDTVRIDAAGDVATVGAGLGEGGYAIRAGKDARIDGALESGSGVAVSAEGAIAGSGKVKAREAVALAAGGSVDVAGALGGAAIRISAAGRDGAGDIRLGGDVGAPGAIALDAARDTTIDASVVSATSLRLATRRNLTVHGTAGSSGGEVALTGVLGDVVTTGHVVSPHAVTVTAGRDAMLGGKVVANGPVSVAASGGSIVGSADIATNSDLTLRAGREVNVGGAARSFGAIAIEAGAGSASIAGTLVADGAVAVMAARDVAMNGSIASGGGTTIIATGGTAAIGGALGSMADATVKAGHDVLLAGSVTTGRNVSASAGGKLAVGDLTWIGGDAMLDGDDIRIGSAPARANVVNGSLFATARGGIALGGDTQAAHIALRGKAIANEGTTVAAGRMTVGGALLENTGMLAGERVDVATGDLVNRGTLGGQDVGIAVAGALDNAQGLLAGARTLDVTVGALAGNRDGTLFAGDLTGKDSTVGDLSLVITGAEGGFDNAGGQVVAGNDLTVHAHNLAFDPLAAATGTLDANGTLTLAVRAIRNSGTWQVAGGNAVLHADEGIANTGTMLKAGDLALHAGGQLDNSGQIIGTGSLSLSGSAMVNNGIAHANRDLRLGGTVINRGTAEALRDMTITGGGYDNRGGITQAGRDLSIDVSGTVDNIGSVIGANGDMHIAAAAIVNDRTAPVEAGSTTTKAVNEGLVASTVIGSYRPWLDGGSCDGCTGPVEGPPQSITLADLMRGPDGSIRMAMGTERVYVGVEQSAADGYFWHLIPATANPLAVPSAHGVGGVPTVDRTVTRQSDGVAGQIVAGGNLDIVAATLSNVGGVLSAGRDVTLDVGRLDNGRSATLVGSVTDAVNRDEFAALLATLASYVNQRYASTVTGPLVYGVPPPRGDCDDCTGPPPWSPIALGVAGDGSPASAPTLSSVSYQLGKAGQISAGGDLRLRGRGDLANDGDLAAAGGISIMTPGTFTNRGVYESRLTATPGCMAGAPDCPDDSSPHVDRLAWQQTQATVAAGRSLDIQAANIQNLNATLAAQGNVSLGAGGSVINASGAVQSLLGDVALDAPALVNKAMDPVRVHKSYGGMNPPYAGGCNPAGTHGNSQCAAEEDTAAGPAGIIAAARDVKLAGTTLSNRGALIAGGRDVTVDMVDGVDNASIALNADWIGRWQERRAGGDRWHDTGGRSAIGSLESAIQAGGSLSVSAGGRILNTGNLLGGAVDVTGAALINGFTSPAQPTPPATAGRQVIPLGPVAAPEGAVAAAKPVRDPTRPWHFAPAVVATPVSPTAGGPATVEWHFHAALPGDRVSPPEGRAQYVGLSAAQAVLAGITPDSLLAQLPAELRGGGLAFYYDPYTEGLRLQQAALQHSGRSTFLDGLAWDSQTRLSIADQEKLVLYRNAAEYAKAHHIALGHALTAEQVAALDAPMLWYVEQAVPDPDCDAVAGNACPLVHALVPQVYLPAGHARALTKATGGNIAGGNVTLDIQGQLRNSGRVLATDSLSVRAGSIKAAPNVVSIGTSAYRTKGGWNEVTGTAVQPGGVMSAMRMQIDAGAIHAVNDAFLIRGADGSVDEAATLRLLDQLKANLGLDYTEGTVADDIHTHFIKERTGLGPIGQIAMMVAAVAVAVVTSGAASAALASAQAAAAESGMTTLIATGSVVEASAAGGVMASSAFAAGGIGNLAIAGALGGMASSAAMQLGMTGKLDLKQLATAGVAGAVTGGVTGYYGPSYGVERLLASAGTGCATAAIQGDDCGAGAIAGFGTAAVAWAADAMRQDQIESSRRFKGIVDAGKAGPPELVSNATGKSVGVNGDRFKLAGTRVSVDDLRKYGTVEPLTDGVLAFQGVALNPKTKKTWTLAEALAKDGGFTGGFQGGDGTFGGEPYSPGSFADKLMESFAGPHDYLGSFAGYDPLGNLRGGMTTFERAMFEIQTVIDIPLAAPFAGVTLLEQYGMDWSAFHHQNERSRRNN